MVLIVIGVALVIAGLTAKKFSVGLTSRISISPWQGRIWLVLSGSVLIAMGLADKFSGARIWSSIFAVIESGYEVFIGLILFLVGGGFAIFGKTVDSKTRLLFTVAGLIGGLALITDAIQKL